MPATTLRSRRARTKRKPIEHAIRNASEYRATIGEIEDLLDAPSGTADADRLELLSILVEVYEAATLPAVRNATPQEIVQFMAAQRGIERGALAALMGGRSRLSEFLAGKRDLSKSQVTALRDSLGIPLDLLL